MSWPEAGWNPIEPFPSSKARQAFAGGITADQDKVFLRYFHRPDGALVGLVTFGPGAEGAPGRVHGGAILTALDEALGAAAWEAGIPCFTVRLDTQFRRAVAVGGPYLISTRLVGERHGLVDVEGSLASEAGVLASAEGRFKRLSVELQKRLFGRAI